MKRLNKLALGTLFLVLVNSTINAGEIPTNQNDETSISTPSAQDLQDKIDKFEAYLTQLPIEIKKTIGELKSYKAKGERAKEMVVNLMVTLDNCANRELDPMAQDMCDTITNTSVGTLIKDKKTQIANAIEFVEKTLKDLRGKEGNSVMIRDGIRSLENARDILLGRI